MAEMARRETVVEAIEAVKRHLMTLVPGSAEHSSERRRLEKLRGILAAHQEQ